MINQIEQIRETRKWGNSGGVLLPREWIGKQVKIILIDRSKEIKKEVFDILSEYLEDIQGIYLVGSYARNEQEEDSDIDIIAISNNTKKIISSGKYNIQIYTLHGLKNTLKNYPISVYPSLLEAKSIMNQALLKELKETKISKDSFTMYLEESKRVLNIHKKLIKIETEEKKEEGKQLTHSLKSINIIYSIFLRLRGLYLIKLILSGKNSTKKEFYSWFRKNTNLSDESWDKALSIYKAVKDNKTIKAQFSIEDTLKILNLLERTLKEHDKPQKKAAKRD
ncbi:MAG: DUF2080 family transposase-associated protein [Candidatus Pacearchaeota archaeon]|nr:DUF2080 family transposase-associated protein [Candidatus Pacearchaeota archaeon]